MLLANPTMAPSSPSGSSLPPNSSRGRSPLADLSAAPAANALCSSDISENSSMLPSLSDTIKNGTVGAARGQRAPFPSTSQPQGARKAGRPKGKSKKYGSLPQRASGRRRSISPPPGHGVNGSAPRTDPGTSPQHPAAAGSNYDAPSDDVRSLPAPDPAVRTQAEGDAARSLLGLSSSASAAKKKVSSIPTPTQPKAKRQRTKITPPPRLVAIPCEGLYGGCFGAALSFAGQSMLNTGQKLIKWAREGDAGLRSFSSSVLASSSELLLPYYGLTLRRAKNLAHGFAFFSKNCVLRRMCSGKRSEAPRCDQCAKAQRIAGTNIRKAHQPIVVRAHRFTNVEHIGNDPAKAKLEIIALRKENRSMKRKLARKVFKEEMAKDSVQVSRKEGKRVRRAVEVMSDTVEEKLRASGDEEGAELWLIHRDSLNEHFKNGGKSRKKRVPVHPVILNWAIAFLAKTSSSIYREVAKIMMLPDISYVYRKSQEMVSRSSDKGYAIHIATLRSL